MVIDAQVELKKLDEVIINCRKCPRLVLWREKVAKEKRRAYLNWEYWGKPVTGFGDIAGRIIVVGLAPGAHGANRTGRVFTGDRSSDFLASALYRAGLANQPQSVNRNDGLILRDVYITLACKCVPPKNRPKNDEIKKCMPYLIKELRLMNNLKVIVTLGKIAFDTMKNILEYQKTSIDKLTFHHGAEYQTQDNLVLIASYHPSQRNTQTGRLTQEMFDMIWGRALEIINKEN